MSDENPASATEPIVVPVNARRMKIGKVKNWPPCTLKMPGCKARESGNVFPIDHPAGDFRAPFDHVCTNCMNKMLDESKWVISEKG